MIRNEFNLNYNETNSSNSTFGVENMEFTVDTVSTFQEAIERNHQNVHFCLKNSEEANKYNSSKPITLADYKNGIAAAILKSNATPNIKIKTLSIFIINKEMMNHCSGITKKLIEINALDQLEKIIIICPNDHSKPNDKILSLIFNELFKNENFLKKFINQEISFLIKSLEKKPIAFPKARDYLHLAIQDSYEKHGMKVVFTDLEKINLDQPIPIFFEKMKEINIEATNNISVPAEVLVLTQSEEKKQEASSENNNPSKRLKKNPNNNNFFPGSRNIINIDSSEDDEYGPEDPYLLEKLFRK